MLTVVVWGYSFYWVSTRFGWYWDVVIVGDVRVGGADVRMFGVSGLHSGEGLLVNEVIVPF